MYQQSSFRQPGAGEGAASNAALSRSAVLPMIETSILRLEEIVEQETLALKTRKAINLKEFNDRKSQALLELTRFLRQVQGTPGDAALASRVGSLKVKLAANQAALKVHLEAVREISASISDAIRDSESDGTYSQSISLAGRR